MSVMKDDNPLDHVLAPSAGQDTGRLRDELIELQRAWAVNRPSDRGAFADALLSGPLARLVAERDEARATVQRVRELLAAVRGYDTGPDDLWDRLSVPIGRVRRALDGPA